MDLTKKMKQGVVLLFLAGFGLFLVFQGREEPLPPPEQERAEIMVHITGEVMEPGVISLPEGARLKDAIEAAGGLTAEAKEEALNLSMRVYDEDKIVIPSNRETTPLGFAASDRESVVHRTSQAVNINLASKEDLMTLPGIGEVKAEKIIMHREEKPFRRIEDIKAVPGIGEKTFETLKEWITVE